MHNYKLTIQYDGTDWHGWQKQKNASSVQEELTKSIETVFREKINLIGSSRTDTGVHALGQTANFTSIIKMDKDKLRHSLNGLLPNSIAITKIEKTQPKFHSRFFAKKRSYIYLFCGGKSPFYYRYSAFRPDCMKWDIAKLNEISKILIGEYDFTSFCKKGSSTETMICNINKIHWRRTGSLVLFYIESNRYLRGMVRLIVGTILTACEKEDGENFLADILLAKDNQLASAAVPAEGLFLFKVKY